MQYFVSGNVRHNGKRYVRGDSIEVDGAQAEQLVNSGAIQGDPIPQEPEHPAEPEKPRSSKKPKVGGRPTESGEPSIDPAPEAPRAKAEDITPPTEEPVSDPSADL
jgi:hypothetical protein